MVCGAPLVYLEHETAMRCFYCGAEQSANATCANGHFVCDRCHAQDALSAIKKICTETGETDMIALLQLMRSQARFPVHGPEHHALVPAVVLSAYRNSGGALAHERLIAGIERGRQIPGGACGFMGVCGAAIGAGIAFSVILEAHPLTPRKRRICLSVTADVMNSIAQFTAARCCQRECFIALKRAAVLSRQHLDIPLTADAPLLCAQHELNSECITSACPLYRESGQAINTKQLTQKKGDQQ
jgi:hypothetical protein